MSWIKKTADVEVAEELNYESNSISKTDAYEVEITDAYLAESQDSTSKSVSLVVGVKNEDGETNRTYFTIMGRDGKTFYETTVKGQKKKKQHFGLNIADTLFNIVLEKSIFDLEPQEVEYDRWDKEAKELVKAEADGFPELIGKTVGITLQMNRKIDGADSKEFGTIEHFFNTETGLFANEEDSDKRKLDKWINGMKEFKVEVVEQQEKRSSFGKKAETGTDGEQKKSKWGR